MTTKTFTAPAISCGHCTHTVEMEVGELAGVTAVTTNQESKKVTVQWQDPASWEQINALLHEINYPPQELVQLN